MDASLLYYRPPFSRQSTRLCASAALVSVRNTRITSRPTRHEEWAVNLASGSDSQTLDRTLVPGPSHPSMDHPWAIGSPSPPSSHPLTGTDSTCNTPNGIPVSYCGSSDSTNVLTWILLEEMNRLRPLVWMCSKLARRPPCSWLWVRAHG